jgi:hypothetical protein
MVERQSMDAMCMLGYGMVCKGSCGCILPRDARQHMMQRSLVMRADEPRPRGKLALTFTKNPFTVRVQGGKSAPIGLA